MCVERTASTKLPSARESRASVACQYRAAACAEMLCSNLVCVWLMFNTPKIAQALERIYPKTSGKVKKRKAPEMLADQASPGAGTGAVTGAGFRCGAVITSMTAVRMTAAAVTVRSVMLSPAINQPRNSATTGFTNAYVATRAAVLFCKIYRYALNPIPDPKAIR